MWTAISQSWDSSWYVVNNQQIATEWPLLIMKIQCKKKLMSKGKLKYYDLGGAVSNNPLTQYRGHGFDPWSQKTHMLRNNNPLHHYSARAPQPTRPLRSPRAATAEARTLSSLCSWTGEAAAVRSPQLQQSSPSAATRESPRKAMKSQHSQTSVTLKKYYDLGLT